MAWQIDPSHSQIQFAVRHMMISNVRGRFEDFSGTIEFNEENPEQTKIDVKIDAASINTRDERRDTHLRSEDFLNTEKYPYMTYLSRRVEKVGDKQFRITGDLTIRDQAHEVVLDVDYQGSAQAPWGSVSAGFSVHAKLDRTEWGLVYNATLETGGILVGNDVKIDIELELVKQQELVEA